MCFQEHGRLTDIKQLVEAIDINKICYKKITWKWYWIPNILKKITNKQTYI